LHADSQDRVVAYRNTERWVQVQEPAKIRLRFSVTAKPQAEDDPPRPLRRGGTYLITGGLGGLGLELAEYLARKAQAKLILIGRTPLPEASEWDVWLASHEEQNPISAKIRRLRAIEKSGGSVLALAADVSDRQRMSAVIAEARRRFGDLHGVVHTAGTLDDGLIQLKTAESAWGVLAPKVMGTLVLDEVLKGQPLDFFVLFSSVSTILGLEGQVDYTAANAFLDAFAAQRSARCPGQTVAINWSAWQEVGMAARMRGEGRGARGEAEIQGAPRPSPLNSRPSSHPWLERRSDDNGSVVFVTQFSRSRQWLLAEHALRGGDALIPGTGFLELARAALAEVACNGKLRTVHDSPHPVEISRVIFQAPFLVSDGETKELALAMTPAANGWDFNILSQSKSVTHVTGHVAAFAEKRPSKIDIAALCADCNSRTEVLDGFLKQSFMDFGPRWANVRQIRYGSGQALVTLELAQDFAQDLDAFPLHPALLDMATGGAQSLITGFDSAKDFYVPFSYGRVVLWKGFSRRLHSHIRLREGKGQGFALFDVTIAAEDGTVLAEISEFMMKRVSDLSVVKAASFDDSKVKASSFDNAGASLAAEVLRHGIAPQEGVEAFERILAWGEGPQIIVSPVDPRHWQKKADDRVRKARIEAQRSPGTSREESARPTPEVHSATPLTPATDGSPLIETGLKKLYSQLLGVDYVSVRDDFFELGGHSLLAVRLLTRIEKEFKKAISLAELFQAPTIENLATLIRGSALPTRKESRIIVPFNEFGKGPAFYCVHSVGGEVASFRHLARLLGPEHRFYGVQAPPELQQDADFAGSIESMAKCYVDALLAFQPEGPFVLGGWSAGSTIALEMAQQLIAAGHKVELLIALDGAPFNTGTETSLWNPIYYWKLLRNLPHWIADDLMLGFSLPAFSRRVWNKIASLTKKLFGRMRGKKAKAEVGGFMDMSHYSPTQAGFMNAVYSDLCKYEAKPYPGRVVLYQSRTQPLYHLFEVDRAWLKVAAHVDVVVVPGTHVSIVQEPHIRVIADDVRDRLKNLDNCESAPSQIVLGEGNS
jgi:thioesterase domain-containing protein/NAD(P)-dependent dehydrogenase (short-subunit alcohol dehydrogenase family)/acyl carrier protein